MQEDLVQYVRTLTHLRAATPALRGGALVHLLVEDDAYAFARIGGGSRVIVVFNEGAAPATLHIPLDGTGIPDGARLENLLATTPPADARSGALDLDMPGRSVAIYR